MKSGSLNLLELLKACPGIALTFTYLPDKGGRHLVMTTLPPSCADCQEIWEPQPPGTLRACPGLSRPVEVLLYLSPIYLTKVAHI